MSFLSQLIINYGIPQETLVLLLMLPIIATVIAFARQIIGIKGFGIYTPLIISITFVLTGIKYGLIIFTTVLLVGTLTRLAINKLKLRLLYLPRIAIIIIAVAVSIIPLFLISARYYKKGLTQTSVFAVLIMITLIEKFLASQIKRGGKEAAALILETLLLSTFCYYLASWTLLQNTALRYPFWIITISLASNLFLGRWTGLRLYEYFRFKEVIKRVELPDKK